MTESSLCACGCGQTTTIAKRNRPALGHVKGQPTKFASGHNGRCIPRHADERKCIKCLQTLPVDEFRDKTSICRRCEAAYTRQWEADHPEKTKRMRKETHRTSRRRLRRTIIEAYGGRCVICGDPRYDALDIEHVNGDGKAHRDLFPKKGYPKLYYRSIIEAEFPDTIQLLCGSCHNIKTRGGDPAADRWP